MRIYRGQSGVVFPNGKTRSIPYRLGKQQPTGPKSFSTNKNIAIRFAKEIARHYGEGYVPVLITANAKVIRKTSNYDIEKEVIPVGMIDVKSILIVRKRGG
jgi:hypothetical protein